MFDPNTIDISKITFGKFQCPAFNFSDRKMLSLSEVEILPITENPTRSAGESSEHINSLELSLSMGINPSSAPPVVIPIKHSYIDRDGNTIKWQLIAGNHRFKAMQRLGFECWVFDVYEYDQKSAIPIADAILTFQLNENNHCPVMPNTTNDVEKTIIMLISRDSGLVSDDDDSIKAYVNKFCSYMAVGTKQKIVKNVIRHLEIEGKRSFNLKNWGVKRDVARYLKTQDRVSDGKYDAVRNQFGFCLDERSVQNGIVRGLETFTKTGACSYITSYVKDVKTKEQLVSGRNKARQEELKFWENAEKGLAFKKKNGYYPVNLVGFLPQDMIDVESTIIPK